MKQAIVLLFIFCCVAHLCKSQVAVSKITADSTKIYNLSNTGNELIIENDTRTVTGGFLKNRINGRTEFACVIDTFWVGHDTLYYKMCGSTAYKLLSNVPSSRTITINGTTYDLSADRTWSVGTVTSVAAGYGINGGTITTTGTHSIDTFAISTRAWRDKGKDSTNAVTLHTTGNEAASGIKTFTIAINTPKYISTPNPLTDGATITWDLSVGGNASVTLAGNRTLSVTNATAGTYGTLVVTQDGTGSRTLTLPASSKVISGGTGAISLSTTANAIDILTFYYNGTTFFWNYGKNYN
jgi:hypothetical protein